MARQSIVGQIYGYGVSLLAVLIILFTIHGIVNNVFRFINPAAVGGSEARIIMMHHFGGPGMMGPGMGTQGGGNMMWRGTASPAPDDTTQAAPGMGGPMTMHASMEGEGRFNAVRLLVIDIIMLIVGIALFRKTWDWLHQAA